MMNFKENDKVVLKDNAHMMINGEEKSGGVGIIRKVFGGLDIVIVEFDGIPVKVPTNILEKFEEKRDEKSREETFDRMISREDFKKAVAKAANPERLAQNVEKEMSPIALLTVGLTGMIFCKDVEKILFGDDE